MKVNKSFSLLFRCLIALAILTIVLTVMTVLYITIRNGAITYSSSKTGNENSDRSKGHAQKAFISLKKKRVDYIDEDFDDIYFLDEEQLLKYVPPPFSDERMDYFVREHGHKREDNIESATFWWDNGHLKLRCLQVGSSPVHRTLEQVLSHSLKVNNYQIDNWDSIPRIPLEGDWIIRKGTSTEQQMAGLARCIQEHISLPITFNKRQVKKEVLVARSLHGLKPLSGKRYTISVYLNEISTKELAGGGTGTVYEFLHSLSTFLDIPIINEIGESSNPIISWRYYIDKHNISHTPSKIA